MKKVLFALAVLLAGTAYAGQTPSEAPRVEVQTNLGSFVIELYPDRAPVTVSNFLQYVDAGHYSQTLFHRTIPEFMAQGGGFDLDYQQKPTRPGIQNESRNGLNNDRGTVAMARTGEPHSATAQFFVNVVDNPFLNATPQSWGYTVFGRVVEGMDVVDQIVAAPAFRTNNPFDTRADRPLEQIVIQEIRRLGPQPSPQ